MKKPTRQKISHFEEPTQSPGFNFWQASTKWRRQVETALATLTLTHPQFVLLANLNWLTLDNTDITQVELARHCSTDITQTSQVLRSLEQKGFIERLQREGNARAKFPHLTQKGIQLLEKAIPLVESVDRDFFNKLGDDTEKFTQILKILTSD
ncbi:MAG: MarR family transcriptional regulator [Chlamydiota bacterium]